MTPTQLNDDQLADLWPTSKRCESNATAGKKTRACPDRNSARRELAKHLARAYLCRPRRHALSSRALWRHHSRLVSGPALPAIFSLLLGLLHRGQRRPADVPALGLGDGARCRLFTDGLNIWIFSAQHEAPALVQGLFNLVFFLYLVRPEVREKLK